MSIILDGTAGITTPDLTDSSLTSGRVVYAGASGNLTGSSGLTFDGSNLSTTGSLLLGGVASTGSLGEIGLANSKAIRFRNGANSAFLNAMYVDASNNLQLGAGTFDAIISVTNVGEAMRVVSTTGYVGIGTSSPATKLHVNNTTGGVQVRATSDSDVSFSAVATGADSSAFMTVINDARQWTLRVNGLESDQFQIRDSSAGVNRLVIDSSGNVVIGVVNENVASANQRLLITGSPEGATLHGIFIHNNSYSAASARIALSPRYSFLYNTSPYIQAVSESTSAAALTFGTTTGSAVSERARIDSQGNLLVGTTSNANSDKLVVNGGVYQFQTVNGSSAAPATNGGYLFGPNSATIYAGIRFVNQILSNNNTALAFYTTSTAGSAAEVARFEGNGRFYLGTTAADNASMYFTPDANGGSWVSSGSSGTKYVWYFQFNGSTVGTIHSNSGGTAYNTSSDYRMKNSIAPMTGALAKVALLKPVTYKWNVDNSNGEGFIAHELAEVVPQCVSGEKDAVDADGKPIHQGIDTSFLVATLTAAIQEQQAIIESLKARLDAANL